MQTVRSFETERNKYYVGYGRITKTTYEQQQEYKAERIRMIQKLLLIVGLITACTILSFLSLELLIPMVLTGLLGIVAILTNNI